MNGDITMTAPAPHTVHQLEEETRIALDYLRRAVANTNLDTDEKMVDAAGILRWAENEVKALRVSIEAETPDAPVAGDLYRRKAANSATRSYNTSAILASIAGAADVDPTTALHLAIRDGAAKLTWGWTALGKMFNRLDIPMVKASHEITDGATTDDGVPVHVGEVWSTRWSLEGNDGA